MGFEELAAPAGVKWFEVDKLDVLNAKRRSLEAAGASCKPGQGARSARPADSHDTCRAHRQAAPAILPGMQASLAATPLAKAVGMCTSVMMATFARYHDC